MGLNQAPMAVMIENHRSGVIWKNFMANPEVQPMVQKTESLSAAQSVTPRLTLPATATSRHR